MKRTAIVALSLVVILTACAPVLPGAPSSQSTEQPAPTGLPPRQDEELRPVEAAVVKQLAGNLGLEPGQISVVSNTSVEFSDTCLGVALQDVMCAEAITPGHVIVLEANGLQYEYHTSEDGARIQPATTALTWRREGGIAGFCDHLTVFRSGEVYGSRCTPAADGRMDTFASPLFNAVERDTFRNWVLQFGQLSIDATEPKGGSDRMLVTLVFEGAGNQQTISPSEKQALLEFAQLLHQKIFSQDSYK